MIRQPGFQQRLARGFERRSYPIVRPAIAIGVLLFVAAYSLVSYRLNLTYLVALAGILPALGFLFLVIRQPVIGIFATVLGGIFVPMTGPGGINAAAMGVLVLLGVWIYKMVAEERRLSVIASKTIPPALVFIVSAILSFFFGQLPWYSFASHAPMDAQVGGLLLFVLCGGLFLAVPHLIHELRWLKTITWIFLALGGIYVVGRALNLHFFDVAFQTGFIANSMFWTWLAALAFGQLLLNHQLKGIWRLALVGLLGVTAYVAYVINGDWKSGYIPALVAIVTIMAIRYPKLALAAAPLAIAGFIWIVNRAIATDEYSWGTRIDAWVIVLDIARISPILGLGFGNYSFYTPLFPIRGYYNIRFNSHSQYVDIIAQTGLIGLMIFLWWIFEIGRLGWNLRNKVSGGFERGYIYSVLGGIAGSLVAAFLVDWLLPYVYNIGFNGFRASILPWLFFGGLVVLERIVKEKNSIEVKG